MVRKKVGAANGSDAGTPDLTSRAALSTGSGSLVFISHDTGDADLAEAFANLLQDVSGGMLKSFRSSDKKGTSGIEFGTEWYKAIMSQLADATDVVALLTPRSLHRPWILYEAGVAKGKLDTNVLGIALGVPLEKVSAGPFGQFQNCGDDEDSLTKLVIQLLNRNPSASPREEAIRRQVRIFLEEVAKIQPPADGPIIPSSASDNNIAKLFEEVKVMVRELPERVDDRVRSARRGPFKRMRRFHPMMFDEFLFQPGLEGSRFGPATAWLLFISMFKDDLPWMYEISLDLYNALRERDHAKIAEARKELLAVLAATTHSPFLHEMMRPEDEEVFHMVRRMPEMVERFLDSIPKEQNLTPVLFAHPGDGRATKRDATK